MEIHTGMASPSPQVLQGLIEDLRYQLSHAQVELGLYQKRCEQYEQAYEQLHHQLKELLRHRFGKKAERYVDVENPQLSLLSNNP